MGVAPLPRLVQAVAAGEHQVGTLHQRRLARLQHRRREAEGGQFVHGVEHHDRAGPVGDHGLGHRRIQPENRVLDPLLGDPGVH
jgi:hypothetical protein